MIGAHVFDELDELRPRIAFDVVFDAVARRFERTRDLIHVVGAYVPLVGARMNRNPGRPGLDAEASVFRMEDLNPEQDARARALWDSPSLEQTYSKLHGDLTVSMDRLEELPINDSVREAFLLGREGIRHVVLDPLLPEPMVDTDKRSTMVHVLQSYCDKGLHLWARFLAID